MGFFNKDTKTSSSSAAPPAPSSNAMSAPPAPNAAPVASSEKYQPNENIPGLPTPPMPGASLDDIKSQVSSSASSVSPASEPEKTPVSNSLPAVKEELSQQSLDSDDELDSLFDISDLELPKEEETHEEPSQEEHSSDDVHEEEHASSSSQFIAHHKEINETKPFFVTTSQFKALLEIIEGVKQKTKESSERHLRLLDIKSEEDIEYENLKKDFAYIEDKLYEVDTLIFENE